ncbi:hypothetical protein HYDPIDRAFT_33086 [Hydnomerulius pinastri MD-312]|uniref:Unplaced genomic scaffold scaffold_51, whole genome shotgun sequence n=1 Tax=Hydnomerulius pinastri MD-312 TaxID=994086 RepID=A0A0C9W8V1_9AGAM|nr:hypothetical protein HYDPIDRAFT_33086 [Hydnomerulius pinastri MD-312]
MASPPLQSPNGSTSRQSNFQLTQLLTNDYSAYSATASSSAFPSNANNGSSATHSVSEAAQRAIIKCEAHANRTEHARNEAELNQHLLGFKLCAADARAGFTRLIAKGGGHLVLAPIPIPGQQEEAMHTPSTVGPAIMLILPSLSHHHSHRHSSSLNSSLCFPPFPPPSNTTSSCVRP